jgi:hypothetical protein
VVLTAASLTGLAPAAINFAPDSLAALNIVGGSGNNTYTVVNTPASTNVTGLRGNPTVLATGSGDDTVNVLATDKTAPLTAVAAGRGNDVVNVGNAGSLSGIQGIVTISGTPASAHANVDDSADTTSLSNVAVSDTGVLGLAPAVINFLPSALHGLTITGGNGNNTWSLDATSAGAPGRNPVTLNTGTLHDVVNVLATDAADPVTLNTGNALGSDVVNVGTQHRVSPEIAGPLTINNGHGGSKVILDDSLNGATNLNVVLSGTSLTGLAPGAINFGPNALAGLTLSGGFGTNTFTVVNTPASAVPGGDPVVLNTGNGFDTVNVLGTAATAPLTVNTGTGFLNGTRGNDVVNVGNGSLAGLQGTLTLVNGVGSFNPTSAHVTINDGADNANHPNVLLSDGLFTGLTDSSLTGLAPAAINFESISVRPLTITLGNDNNIFTVNDTQFGAPPTTLNTGNGQDTVNVQGLVFGGTLAVNAGSGHDVVNVGKAGSLSGINAALTINAAPGAAQVNINDGADNTAHANVVLTATSLSGLAPAAINFGANALAGLTITVGNGNNTYTVVNTPASTAPGGDPLVLNTGNGNDTVNVQGKAATAPLTVNAGSGRDTINVGSAANTLDPIQGAVTVHGGLGGADTLNINDQGSTSPHTYAVTPTSVTRSPGGPVINYSTIQALNVHPGRLGTAPLAPRAASAITSAPANVLDVLGTAAGTTVALGPTGGATVNVGNDQDGLDELQGPLQVGGDTTVSLTVNDQMTAGAQEYDLRQGELDRSGAAPITFANLGGEVVNGGANGNLFDVDGVSAGTPATVNTGLGNNLVRVRQHDRIGDALTLNGQGQSDALGYVAYTTDVYVNLQTGVATDLAGFSGFHHITGGAGNNILVGDGTQDSITGGSGPNLIISGGGSGQISGGGAGDVLIGGTTAYDQDQASLQAILAYWAQSGDDYATRVANLAAGNGVPQLAAGSTVFANGAANTLTGNGNEGTGALNLFFYTEAGGAPTDQQPSEVALDLDAGGPAQGGPGPWLR